MMIGNNYYGWNLFPNTINKGAEIIIPEFNTSQGLQGLASFMDGMSELGGSMNRLLADLTETVTGKAGESTSSELSLGFELDADRHFDLTVDARQGSLEIEPPTWRHGISMTALERDDEQGFHVRTWLPGLAPDVKTAISFRNESGLEIWDIEVEMSDWIPAREEFIVEINTNLKTIQLNLPQLLNYIHDINIIRIIQLNEEDIFNRVLEYSLHDQ